MSKKYIIFIFLILIFSSCIKKKLQDRIAAFEKEGKLPEIIQEYREKILKNTSDPMLHFELANLYERVGDLDRAMQEYKAVVIFDKSFEGKVNSKISELNMKQAKIEMEKNNFETAISYYKTAIAIFPENANIINPELISIYKNSANSKIKQNNFEAAMTDYSEILKYDVKNEEALTGQIACLIGLKKYDEAKQEIEKMKSVGFTSLDSVLADLKLKLGDISFNSGDYEKTKTYYDEAIELAPELSEKLKSKYLALETAVLKKMIDTGSLENALVRLKEIKSSNADFKYELMEADIYEKQKKRDLLISKYEELLEAYPGNKNLYKKLIKFYQDDNNVNEEIKIMKKQIAVFGIKEGKDIAEEVAKYEFSKANYKEAIEIYTKLAKAFPQESKYLYEQVVLFTKLRDNKNAKKLLDEATKKDPKPAASYFTKYDISFRIYIRKEFYIKLFIAFFAVLLALFSIIRYIFKRRAKIAYQTT